jgi:hypothetical protein
MCKVQRSLIFYKPLPQSILSCPHVIALFASSSPMALLLLVETISVTQFLGQ